MLSINTNLSSLIVQSNLNKSILGLNQAIERMTTGFKINHAKDNAANYSISTNITSQLSSYEVAMDNVAMGLDLITTASDSLDLITSHMQRIRDLTEQAANGTYGKDSLDAIQAEVDARNAEIERIMANTEYNGLRLFKSETGAVARSSLKARSAGTTNTFLKEVTPLSESEAIAQGYTIIKTADQLQAMQDNLSGKYILMNDIDLAGYDWTPVGTYDKSNYSGCYFTGELNGNGYVIKNLTINKPNEDYVGLFGYVGEGKITNLGLINVDVRGNDFVGGIVGYVSSQISDVSKFCEISNCYVYGGNILGLQDSSHGRYGVGGLVGVANGGASVVDSCYAVSDVKGDYYVGGLLGDYWYNGATINNSFSSGSVTGEQYVGGFLGGRNNGYCIEISNSYSDSTVTGNTYVGGFAGDIGISNADYIANCYWDIEKSGTNVGVGEINKNPGDTNIYSSSDLNITGVTTSELQALKRNGSLPSLSSDVSSLPDDLPSTPSEVPSTPEPSLMDITFQEGINSDSNSQITLNLGFSLAKITVNVTSASSARHSLTKIDDILSTISKKQTEYGAAQNRLESAAESISVSIDNLTSTQSTIRDADIAEESSEYIKNQILQQAAATLLATANQSPAIALQLI